jgi:hypothetical protein
MDRHCFRADHVRGHEPSSRASSMELDSWTAGKHLLLGMDYPCKEPSAAHNQPSGHDPVPTRAIPTLRLTSNPNEGIL